MVGELRMRDVMERTGLSRQAIHFYVEQGLVARPHKTGKTMGYYTEAHVERILLIRKLAEEHFLPLKAIRAMLDDKQGDFTRAQHQVLREVKSRLSPSTTAAPAPGEVGLAELLARTRLPRREITELERAGVVVVQRGRVSADHAYVIELWGALRAAGFTRELGFGPELLAIVERGIAAIFEDEKQVLLRLAATLPAAKVAEMVERALPLVHGYLVHLHQAKVRGLFASLEAS